MTLNLSCVGSIALQDLSYTNPITGGGAAVNNNGQHVQENGCEVSRQQPPVPVSFIHLVLTLESQRINGL